MLPVCSSMRKLALFPNLYVHEKTGTLSRLSHFDGIVFDGLICREKLSPSLKSEVCICVAKYTDPKMSVVPSIATIENNCPHNHDRKKQVAETNIG